MWSRWRVICSSLMGRPSSMPIFNDFLDFIRWKCLLFLQTEHLNFIILVLEDLKLLFIIEQIEALSSINLEHRHIKFTSIIFLLSNSKNVIYCIFGDGINCKGLTRSSLAIRKACYDSIVKNTWQQVFDRKLVHILRIFVLIKSVVKGKVGVVNILGYSIDLDFGLMHHNFWITGTNRIDLSFCVLLLKKWSFPDANAYVHLGGAYVI